jgi:CMP-N,N'-diacetyllegionaminic acid synthase
MTRNKIIGLIPARSGSKRVPGKNIRMLGDVPLIAWTIRSAREADIFSDIVVSTDSQEIIEIAESFGASAAILRPREISFDLSKDVEWVRHALKMINSDADSFGILRPTNPFRTANTIKDCWDIFRMSERYNSLRTMRPAKEHPAKAWQIIRGRAIPCLNVNWYDFPTNRLPYAYYQDGLFYIGDVKLVGKDLFCEPIMPYNTCFPENLDINTEEDWALAENIMQGNLRR